MRGGTIPARRGAAFPVVTGHLRSPGDDQSSTAGWVLVFAGTTAGLTSTGMSQPSGNEAEA
ncbi:hypothetical protein [Nocardia pseudovaccinii]|uniref:hypothetical protein n=1 Tax=Nocardia pseudovaccinii TaxID=189540 RepID=UPI0007A38500|nr:hypothetical protein [Nocardia pseudovaccinii]